MAAVERDARRRATREGPAHRLVVQSRSAGTPAPPRRSAARARTRASCQVESRRPTRAHSPAKMAASPPVCSGSTPRLAERPDRPLHRPCWLNDRRDDRVLRGGNESNARGWCTLTRDQASTSGRRFAGRPAPWTGSVWAGHLGRAPEPAIRRGPARPRRAGRSTTSCRGSCRRPLRLGARAPLECTCAIPSTGAVTHRTGPAPGLPHHGLDPARPRP